MVFDMQGIYTYCILLYTVYLHDSGMAIPQIEPTLLKKATF